jgi:hypothetical protein
MLQIKCIQHSLTKPHVAKHLSSGEMVARNKGINTPWSIMVLLAQSVLTEFMYSYNNAQNSKRGTKGDDGRTSRCYSSKTG